MHAATVPILPPIHQQGLVKFSPYDIKAILHPIDFAFDGINGGQVKNVGLLSNRTDNPHLQNIHKAIADAVKSYDWQVMRVLQDGEVEFK